MILDGNSLLIEGSEASRVFRMCNIQVLVGVLGRASSGNSGLWERFCLVMFRHHGWVTFDTCSRTIGNSGGQNVGEVKERG